MWHVFYKENGSFRQRLNTKSYACCATEQEAKEQSKLCRRNLKVRCWVKFIALRADLDG